MSEIIIYQAYSNSFYLAPFEARTFYLSNFLLKAAKILAAIGFAFLVVSYAPSVWYWALGAKSSQSVLLYETAVSQPTTDNRQPTTEIYQPRFDATLPMAATLEIPAIGVIT